MLEHCTLWLHFLTYVTLLKCIVIYDTSLTKIEENSHNVAKDKKWDLVSVLYNLHEILEYQDYRLFIQIVTDPQHCLNCYSLQ